MRSKRHGRLVLTFGLAGLVAAGLLASRARTGHTQEPQPLAFSHRIHAQENGIPCLFCHAYARRGPVAGLPSVQRCASCHASIARRKPEVQKLLEYWKRREPIPWTRVHDLPDFVRFSHKRHVLAEVDCRECHGEVERMEAARRVSSLEMGFCLECHERRKASTDCLTCHY